MYVRTLPQDIAAPNAHLCQFFAVNAAKHVKSVHGSDVKVYAWEAGDVYSLVHMFGPKDLGGRGDMAKEVEDELQRTGGARDEVTLSVCCYLPDLGLMLRLLTAIRPSIGYCDPS